MKDGEKIVQIINWPKDNDVEVEVDTILGLSSLGELYTLDHIIENRRNLYSWKALKMDI